MAGVALPRGPSGDLEHLGFKAPGHLTHQHPGEGPACPCCSQEHGLGLAHSPPCCKATVRTEGDTHAGPSGCRHALANRPPPRKASWDLSMRGLRRKLAGQTSQCGKPRSLGRGGHREHRGDRGGCPQSLPSTSLGQWYQDTK